MGQNEIDSKNVSPLDGGMPIIPAQNVSSAAPASSSDQDVSTIQSSSSTSSTYVPDAAYPDLEEPIEENIDALFKLNNHKMIGDMLDRWLEDVETTGRRIREEMRSPKYLEWLRMHSSQFYAEIERGRDRIKAEHLIVTSPDYLAWLSSLVPAQRSVELNYQKEVGVQLTTSEIVGNYASRAADSFGVPLIAASFAVATTGIGEIVTTKELGQATDLNASAFKHMWDQVSNGVSPEQRPDILGLIGAIMMVRLTAQATANSIAPAAGAEAATNTKKFADEYAKVVIQLVSGNGLDKTSQDMLSGKSPTPQQGAILLKIAFIATALVLLYKNEAGKMTGDEFLALLNGKIPLKEGDSKFTLVSLMKGYFNQLPADKRVELYMQLAAYVDSNPQVEKKMAEASRLYTGLMKSMPNPGPIAG